jgi:hypothetical protein
MFQVVGPVRLYYKGGLSICHFTPLETRRKLVTLHIVPQLYGHSRKTQSSIKRLRKIHLRHFEIPTHHGARQQELRMRSRRVLQSEDMLHVVPFNWQWQAWVFVW